MKVFNVSKDYNILQKIYGNVFVGDTTGTKNPWIWSTIKPMFYLKNNKSSLVILGSNNYDYNILRRLVFLRCGHST
jgi:hypothetical protein